MYFKLGDKVVLKSFFGTTSNIENIDEKENYWKFIGYKGEVIKIKEDVHPAFPDRKLHLEG